MHVIKRYPNRKLYDTESKTYITLEGIADLIRSNEDVQVTDHETGEDLTTVTLSQIILELEKRQASSLPKTVLTSLIRTGGDTLDVFKRSFYSSMGAIRIFEESIERRVDQLVRRGQMTEDEGRQLRENLLSHTKDFKGDVSEAPIGPLDVALDRLNIPTRADLKRLSLQLEELTAKIDALLGAETEGEAQREEPAE